MRLEKAVPVVLRQRGGIDILAFRHPRAGLQIVKGTIEPGESAAEAAVRELAEEAGIVGARATGSFGSLVSPRGETWHFVRVATDELAESWTHHCDDDGGHDFAFFWHSLESGEGEEWDPLFRQLLGHIRAALG